MAGAKLKVELEGMPEVLGVFNRLVGLGERPRPALVDLGEYLKIRTEERFRAETAPGGAKWAPLAPATLERKRGPKILTETGHMRYDTFAWQADETTLEFGSSAIQAAIHQFGGRAGCGHQGTIPPRPFLGMDEEDAEASVGLFRDA